MNDSSSTNALDISPEEVHTLVQVAQETPEAIGLAAQEESAQNVSSRQADAVAQIALQLASAEVRNDVTGNAETEGKLLAQAFLRIRAHLNEALVAKIDTPAEQAPASIVERLATEAGQPALFAIENARILQRENVRIPHHVKRLIHRISDADMQMLQELAGKLGEWEEMVKSPNAEMSKNMCLACELGLVDTSDVPPKVAKALYGSGNRWAGSLFVAATSEDATDAGLKNMFAHDTRVLGNGRPYHTGDTAFLAAAVEKMGTNIPRFTDPRLFIRAVPTIVNYINEMGLDVPDWFLQRVRETCTADVIQDRIPCVQLITPTSDDGTTPVTADLITYEIAKVDMFSNGEIHLCSGHLKPMNSADRSMNESGGNTGSAYAHCYRPKLNELVAAGSISAERREELIEKYKTPFLLRKK